GADRAHAGRRRGDRSHGQTERAWSLSLRRSGVLGPGSSIWSAGECTENGDRPNSGRDAAQSRGDADTGRHRRRRAAGRNERMTDRYEAASEEARRRTGGGRRGGRRGKGPKGARAGGARTVALRRNVPVVREPVTLPPVLTVAELASKLETTG